MADHAEHPGEENPASISEGDRAAAARPAASRWPEARGQARTSHRTTTAPSKAPSSKAAPRHRPAEGDLEPPGGDGNASSGAGTVGRRRHTSGGPPRRTPLPAATSSARPDRTSAASHSVSPTIYGVVPMIPEVAPTASSAGAAWWPPIRGATAMPVCTLVISRSLSGPRPGSSANPATLPDMPNEGYVVTEPRYPRVRGLRNRCGRARRRCAPGGPARARRRPCPLRRGRRALRPGATAGGRRWRRA